MTNEYLALAFVVLAGITSVSLIGARVWRNKGFGMKFLIVFLAQLLIFSAAALALAGVLTQQVAIIYSGIAGALTTLLSTRYGEKNHKADSAN